MSAAMPITRAALNDAERASVILMLLGDDEAATILARLEPDELQLVGQTMCDLGDVGPDWIASAIAGFIGHAERDELPSRDRYDRFRTVMTQAVGGVKADGLMQRIEAPTRPQSIELARWLAPDVLLELIQDEHPQAIAVLLLMLDPVQAAQLLAGLPEDLQPAIVERIARLGPVSSHAVAMLNTMLTDRIGRQFGNEMLKMGGAREAAELINQANSSVERLVMPAIGAKDAELAKAIEAEMFKFDLVLGLEPLPMGRLLRDVENDILIDALKGLSEEERDPFFAAMSERAADGVREEIELRGRIKKEDVESAQQRIIDEARKLAEQGEIQLGDGDGDGDYV